MPSPRKQNWHCCSTPGCHHLVSAAEPCPVHGRRDKNAPWSKHRPPEWRGQQHQLRQAALARAGNRCERVIPETGQRCTHQDPTGKTLHVHHLRGAEDMRLEHAQLVCIPCHKAIDPWARG